MINWLKWHITNWLGTNPETMPIEKLATLWHEHDVAEYRRHQRVDFPFVWYSPARGGSEIPLPEWRKSR